MAWAIFFSGTLIIIAAAVFRRRNRFASFACLKDGGRVRERIVCFPVLKNMRAKIMRDESLHGVFERLNHEIRLFNRLKVVMPCRRGVPVGYINCLSNLVLNPRWVAKFVGGADRTDDGNLIGFFKLVYLYAAANLWALETDSLVKKQLLKNCLYVFGRTVIKRKAKFVLVKKHFTAYKIAQFKFLGGKFIESPDFEIQGQTLRRRDAVSYTTFYNRTTEVKHFTDKELFVQCYEVRGNEPMKFTWFVGADKMSYTLSHTADTFYAVEKNRAVGIYADKKVEFGSSICEHTENLRVYLGLSGTCTVYVAEGRNKNEVTAIIGEIKRRRGNLDYLCDAWEAETVRLIERLFNRAHRARFIEGEGLKEKFAAASVYVPTLFLPTLVYPITEQDDYFRVESMFPLFKKIAAAKRNLNVVFLYSGMNDTVREIINAFADKSEAQELIKSGVFLFFVDRVTTKNPAVNYLDLIGEAGASDKAVTFFHNQDSGDVWCNNAAVEITRHLSKSFPVTHSIFVRNTSARNLSAKVSVPIDVSSDGYASVISKSGACVQISGLKNHARAYNFKLPVGAAVVTEYGRKIINEAVCGHFIISADVKLRAHEEKVLKIIKNDGSIGRRGKKEAFIGSLENLTVRATDKRVERLFALEIAEISADDGVKTEKLLSNLKSAAKNFDVELFFALFNKTKKLDTSIWAFLLEKVIGLRLLKGRVQLMPNICISGDFDLSFNYLGNPYNFSVKQKSGGFSVYYGENEYKNFLQIAVD